MITITRNIAREATKKRSKATKSIEKALVYYALMGTAGPLFSVVVTHWTIEQYSSYYSMAYIISIIFWLQLFNGAAHLVYKVREWKLKYEVEREERKQYQDMLMGAPAQSEAVEKDAGTAPFIMFRSSVDGEGNVTFSDKQVECTPREWVNLLELHPPETEQEYQKLRDCIKKMKGQDWVKPMTDLLNARKKI